MYHIIQYDQGKEVMLYNMKSLVNTDSLNCSQFISYEKYFRLTFQLDSKVLSILVSGHSFVTSFSSPV